MRSLSFAIIAAGPKPAKVPVSIPRTVLSWQDDPGFKEWTAFTTKYMSPADVREALAVYGFTTAATMVHVFEQCGDDLSRENILRQALAIKDLELPMLPGVKINTSPDNYFLDPADATRPVQR
jgi:hypothetical protein